MQAGFFYVPAAPVEKSVIDYNETAIFYSRKIPCRACRSAA
jgi:hypothetical protein